MQRKRQKQRILHGKKSALPLIQLDAIKDLPSFILAFCDVKDAIETSPSSSLLGRRNGHFQSTINLYECRQLLLDVAIHARFSTDSTDYIPVGCREHLTRLIEMGLSAPHQMSPIQSLSVRGLQASAIPPPAGIVA